MDTNPDRMPRRHRWMVNEVGRIEFLFCPREAVEVDLRDFEKIPLDTDAIWLAGRTFRQYRRKNFRRSGAARFFHPRRRRC